MKKAYLLIFIMLTILYVKGQEIKAGSWNIEKPNISGEYISLFTDRNTYCVTEKIKFTAEYSTVKELDSITLSKVLYVELIRWNGAKLVQIKFELTRPEISSSIEIPKNLPSGTYYLRAYTKWMRNFSINEYAYQQVKIVNPFKADTDKGPTENSISINKKSFITTEEKLTKGVKCTLNKKEFSTGEIVEVDLQLNNTNPSKSGSYCITVVKVGAIDTTFNSLKLYSTDPETINTDIEYLPEIRGNTISGKVVNMDTKLPVKDILVSLSEPRNGEYYSLYKTNDSGRFVFSLSGLKQPQYDFYIQAENKENTTLEILVDNGFCNEPVHLPYVIFSLTDNEKDLVKDLVVNMQLSNVFQNDSFPDTNNFTQQPIVFFGSKCAEYFTDKYIELANFGEFIDEIVLETSLAYNKEKALSILMNKENPSIFPPLILMDNIQVDNNEKLLKIPSNRIEKVNVINKDYAIVDSKYAGIISIYSKNKDFAGLDLNRSSLFFSYQLLTASNFDYNYKKPSEERIPDRRNILYWNPDIQLSTENKSRITFYNADDTGEYVILVRNKNVKDGKYIYGTSYFLVK